MRNSMYRITLDMHDVASQVQITAKQHDTARKLHITLSENGSPYTIEEGCRAVLSINRPGSTVIIDDCEIKLNGSVIMYDFNSQTTEVLGINECEVKLYDPDGDIITSPRFTLLVDENVYNDGEDHGIDHRNVLNRDKEDQHPIKAITGLEKELESKANAEKIYAEIALDRSRIDNIAALGQNSVIEVQKKYNTTGDTTPLTFSLDNDGKCVVIIYYYKSAPNTETYSSSVLVNSQSIFTKTLDGAAGTYLEEVEFDGKAGDIVTITRDNVNVSINSVLYVTNKSTDTELADIRLGADGTIYPCAGDAVREQVSALKNDVDSQVGALKSDLDDLFDYESYEYSMWEEGAFSLGVPTDSSKNIRTKDFVDLEKYYGIKSEKLYFRLYAYEPDGTFVGQFNGTDFGGIGTPVHDLSFDIPKKLGYKIKLTCNRENYIYNIYPWEELKLFFIVDKYSPKSEVFEIKETLDTKISTVENKLKSFTDLKRNTDKIGSCEIKVVDFDNASLSDDVIIENALNFSKGFEYRTLVFDTRDWNISKAILIPSNTTIVIDGVTIKQNDEIFDNMFRSGNIVINEEHPNTFPTSITKCENIKIIGKNGAKIIGCDNAKKSINPANNEEQAMETDAWGWRPIGILIVMCNNVEVCGIHFEQSHMWTVSFEKCTNGYVHDLDFYTTKVNHDGVDLRAGCKHFVIENITGTTFDDAVACTCSIPRNQTNETYPINSASIYPCEVSRYLNTDMTNDELAIEDVQVRNVCTGGNCRVVICYSAYGGIIRNVLYDTVSDTDTSESNQIAIFKIYKGNEYVDNSIYNIRVNNLKSNKTYRPVQIIAKSNDVHINKITKSGWMANDITYTDGVIITNVNNV